MIFKLGEDDIITEKNIEDYIEIKEVYNYGMKWKISIHKTKKEKYNLEDYKIVHSPNCMDCNTYLDPSRNIFGKYVHKCPICNKKVKNNYCEKSLSYMVLRKDRAENS